MLVQMDAREIFSAVFRQMWKFLALFIPIVLIALIYAIAATPQYGSNAKLLVRFGQDARPDMAISQNGGGLSSEDKRGLVQSNVNILSSRDLIETLLRDVGVKRAYPEIADSVKGEKQQISAAADQLIAKDLLTRTESGAGIIETTILNENPETAKLLLDKLLTLFVEKQSEIYGNPQAEAIREQADAAYTKLEQANRELFEYKTKVGVASIDEEITLLLKKRSDIAEYLSRNNEGVPTTPVVPLGEPKTPTEIAPVDAQTIGVPANEEAAATEEFEMPAPPLSEITLDETDSEGIEPSDVDILPAKMGELGGDVPFPALDESQKRIDELRAKEVTMRQTYREDSDVMRNLKRNIAAETKVLRKSIDALQKKLVDLDARIAQMSEYKAVYDTLARKVQFSEETYKTAKGRLQAAEVNSDLNQRKITQISVLEQPTVPQRPAKPQKFLIVLLSIIVGGALGVGVCLISELLDQRLVSPSQVSACLRDPLLSSFSLKVVDANGALTTPTYLEQSSEKIREKIMARLLPEPPKPPVQKPALILSQRSMGTLYQSVIAQIEGQPDKKCFLVASAYKDEGAGTIAWEFSRYLAETLGKKVLFVNYGVVPQPGRPTLLDVVQGKGSEDQAIRGMDNLNARVQTAYLAHPDQANLVLANAHELSRLMGLLKSRFDMIFIPASNILAEPSHIGLVRIADASLFVIEADRTRVPVALKAVELLKTAGAQVTGIILNKRIYYIPKWLYQHL